MARIIQEFIKRPLAEELLFGKLVNGGHVEVTLSDDGEKLKLETKAADAKPALLSHEGSA
jgi:ATP-dependent Clp protease ATP-binding subunit ClpA